MAEYKRTKRELAYQGKLVSMYKDHITIDGEKKVVFDFIDHKGAAAMIPVDANGNILMISQYRNAIDRMTLEIPAGGRNEGETLEESAIRECEEETGFHPNHVEHVIDIFTTFAFSNEKIGIYCGTDLEYVNQNLDDDECINVKAYPLDELVQMILDGKIEDSKTISALLAYKTKYQK